MPPVGKSGPRMMWLRSSVVASRMVDQVDDAIANLAQVVRRDVGRHADGDARRAVEQQIWQARWQHHWLFAVAVVVGLEVDGVVVDIGQQLRRDHRHLRLGIMVDKAIGHERVAFAVNPQRKDTLIASWINACDWVKDVALACQVSHFLVLRDGQRLFQAWQSSSQTITAIKVVLRQPLLLTPLGMGAHILRKEGYIVIPQERNACMQGQRPASASRFFMDTNPTDSEKRSRLSLPEMSRRDIW